MSVTIPKIILEKKIEAVILAALLLTTFAVTNHTSLPEREITQEEALAYDVNEHITDVDKLMGTISDSSTLDELKAAQSVLVQHAVWANRQPQTKEVMSFLSYLDDCNNELITYSHKN
jgi:hypothetical protein